MILERINDFASKIYSHDPSVDNELLLKFRTVSFKIWFNAVGISR